VGLGAVLLLRGVGAALAAGRERECRMAKALAVVADDAAQPRLRLAGRVQGHVAVRRGFGFSAEARREVGGRHIYFVYFVKRRARERADELQSLFWLPGL
jgi:hypothetical protein